MHVIRSASQCKRRQDCCRWRFRVSRLLRVERLGAARLDGRGRFGPPPGGGLPGRAACPLRRTRRAGRGGVGVPPVRHQRLQGPPTGPNRPRARGHARHPQRRAAREHLRRPGRDGRRIAQAGADEPARPARALGAGRLAGPRRIQKHSRRPRGPAPGRQRDGPHRAAEGPPLPQGVRRLRRHGRSARRTRPGSRRPGQNGHCRHEQQDARQRHSLRPGTHLRAAQRRRARRAHHPAARRNASKVS